MPYKKSFELRGAYLLVSVSGEVSLDNEIDLECYLDAICQQVGALALLTDTRRARGALSDQEVESLALEIGEFHRPIREAIVDLPERAPCNNDFVAKSLQRGFEIRWFDVMGDAVDWLISGNVLPFPALKPG